MEQYTNPELEIVEYDEAIFTLGIESGQDPDLDGGIIF